MLHLDTDLSTRVVQKQANCCMDNDRKLPIMIDLILAVGGGYA